MVIGVAKHHHTWGLIEGSGGFALHLLHAHQIDLVRRFGLASGHQTDKFAGLPHALTPGGQPFIADALAWLDCRCEARMDTGDRTLYLAAVTDGATIAGAAERTMTVTEPVRRRLARRSLPLGRPLCPGWPDRWGRNPRLARTRPRTLVDPGVGEPHRHPKQAAAGAIAEHPAQDRPHAVPHPASYGHLPAVPPPDTMTTPSMSPTHSAPAQGPSAKIPAATTAWKSRAPAPAVVAATVSRLDGPCPGRFATDLVSRTRFALFTVL